MLELGVGTIWKETSVAYKEYYCEIVFYWGDKPLIDLWQIKKGGKGIEAFIEQQRMLLTKIIIGHWVLSMDVIQILEY